MLPPSSAIDIDRTVPIVFNWTRKWTCVQYCQVRIKESRNQRREAGREGQGAKFCFFAKRTLQNVSVEMIRMFILVPNSSDQKSSDSGRKRWDVGRWWPVLGVVTGGFILSRRPLAIASGNWKILKSWPRTPKPSVPSRTDYETHMSQFPRLN